MSGVDLPPPEDEFEFVVHFNNGRASTTVTAVDHYEQDGQRIFVDADGNVVQSFDINTIASVD
ncbi:MAG: hypothetical protein ACJ72O_11230 [Marmoricola sp.]